MSLAQQTWRAAAPGDFDNAANPSLLCDGRIRIGRVDVETFRPRRIPTDLLAALQ